MECGTRSRLLALPAELRLQIYEYTSAADIEDAIHTKIVKKPSLLQTCKAIRVEASSTYVQQLEAVFAAAKTEYNRSRDEIRAFWSNHNPFARVPALYLDALCKLEAQRVKCIERLDVLGDMLGLKHKR